MAAEAAVVSSDVAIRIDDDDGASSSCCAVCMEPSEWVAVGVCGHRDVCLHCAVRMRFFQDDRRCCICRAFCATVVVTKAAGDGGGRWRAVFSGRTSPALGGEGHIISAGVYHWYHGGMAAYFDDLAAYAEARKMCRKPLRPPVAAAVDERGGGQASTSTEDSDSRLDFLLYLVVMTVLGALGGIPLSIYFKRWLPRPAVVLACGLLVLACAYFDAAQWRRPPESDAQ